MVTNHTKVHQKFISYKPCTQKSKFSVSNDIIFGAGEYMTFSSKRNVKTFKKLTRLISPSHTPHVKKINQTQVHKVKKKVIYLLVLETDAGTTSL
jgi:PP-loop superfamily ATP-utilizing enzyme